MRIFDKFKQKAEDVTSEHGDKVQEGIDKGAEFVDEKTGGKYSDKIDSAADKAREYTTPEGRTGTESGEPTTETPREQGSQEPGQSRDESQQSGPTRQSTDAEPLDRSTEEPRRSEGYGQREPGGFGGDQPERPEPGGFGETTGESYGSEAETRREPEREPGSESGWSSEQPGQPGEDEWRSDAPSTWSDPDQGEGRRPSF